MYPSRIGCTKALDFKYSLLTIKTMAQNYSQLQAHIAKLQSEAETLRKSELAEVIAKIRVAISAYGITREDLFGGKSKTSSALKSVAAPMPASKSKSKFGLTAKFADGTGNTWVGRGPRPVWLREALSKGKSLSDFATQVRHLPVCLRLIGCGLGVSNQALVLVRERFFTGQCSGTFAA